MANTAPVASYDQPDSQPWGAPNGATVKPFGANGEGGFYDERDDMVGGTDTPWCGADYARSYGDTAPVQDAAPWTVTGVLSQSDLVS